MKKILLFMICCAVAFSVYAQRFQRHSQRGDDKKTINFRPVEKMLITIDYNYALSSYNTDDLYITCYYSYNASHRLVWKLCVKSSLTSMNDRFHFTTTKKTN